MASVVVLLHHTFLVFTWGSQAFATPRILDGGGIKSIFFYSPLHMFFAGTEAVLLFFTLSGFVLARTFTIKQATSFGYLSSRIFRLYLPIWGSLCLALILTAIHPKFDSTSANWWMNSHETTSTSFSKAIVNPHEFLIDLQVIFGTDWLNSSLWSMRVEIIFSVFLAGILVLKKWKLVGLIMALTLAQTFESVPFWGSVILYLPYFVLGAIINNVKPLKTSRLSNLHISFGVFAFTLPYVLRIWSVDLTRGLNYQLLILLGCFAFIRAANSPFGFQKFLSTKPVLWLGTRSYSLYLVHAPILVTVAMFVAQKGQLDNLWAYFILPAWVVVFTLTEVFYRFVEYPSHRMARLIRKSI